MAKETKDRKPNPAKFREEKKLKQWAVSGFGSPDGEWLTRARRLRAGYNGKYHRAYAHRNRFIVNTFFSVVQLMLPNLLFGPASIKVSPLNAKYFKKMPDGQMIPRDAVAAAVIREGAIKHCIKKIDMFMEQKKSLIDSFFYGFGICKAGYSYETVSDTDKDYVVKDEYFNKRVDPRDFGWHPLATGMDDSPFFAHRLYIPKADALNIPGINKQAVEDAEPCVPKHLQDRLDLAKRNRKEGYDDCTEEYVGIVELHDRNKEKISLWSLDGESMFKEAYDDPYHFNGSHFTRVQLASDNEVFEGIPLLGMVEDQALVLNELFTLMIEHVRKFPAQLFMNKGAVDGNDLERIAAGEQGSIHTVNDVNQIKPVSPVSMGNDYYNLVRMIQDLVDQVLGIPDFQRGNSSSRRSATEASLIHGDATARRDYYLSLVKTFVLDGVRRIAWLQEQYQDKEEEIQASGTPNGDPITYDKSDIQGDFIYDFDIVDLQASNEVQLNTLTNLVTGLGKVPIMEPVLASINPMKLGVMLFKRGGMNIESIQWSPNDPNMDKVFTIMADKMLQMGEQAVGGAGPATIPNPLPTNAPPGMMGPEGGPAAPMEPLPG